MALSDELTQRLDTLFEKAEEKGILTLITVDTSRMEDFLYDHAGLIVPDEPLDEETGQEYWNELGSRLYDFVRDCLNDALEYGATDDLDWTLSDIAEDGCVGLKRKQAVKQYKEMARADFKRNTLPKLLEERMKQIAASEFVSREDYDKFFRENCAQVTADIIHEFEDSHLGDIAFAYGMGLADMHALS